MSQQKQHEGNIFSLLTYWVACELKDNFLGMSIVVLCAKLKNLAWRNLEPIKIIMG